MFGRKPSLDAYDLDGVRPDEIAGWDAMHRDQWDSLQDGEADRALTWEDKNLE